MRLLRSDHVTGWLFVGPFGIVFLAEDPILGRKVALDQAAAQVNTILAAP